jgi:hypothetical protein
LINYDIVKKLKENNYSGLKTGSSRREFIRKAATATVVMAGNNLIAFTASTAEEKTHGDIVLPWYLRVKRWGQTNITEKDPAQYDIEWWRKHWKNTQIQGVIVNAGGIVAYYPSRVPLHRQSKFLDGRDLFGDHCRSAHEDGLAVFARMDSNRADEEFFKAHPDWFAIDSSDKPYRAGELYITCINGPYYNEHIPAILREVAEKYHPEGFTDNSWSGLGRDSICYCGNCKRDFFSKTGMQLPETKNWNDKSYRQWIRWSYNRRIEIWDMNNLITRSAGGPDCIWSGMNSGSVSGQSASFRDYKELCSRADILMIDSQSRTDATGFQQNSYSGKLIHGLLGWGKLIPESMAMYQAGRPTFRLAAKPVAEAHMWMIEGMAGGIQPWWHYVAAYHEDRRIYKTAGSVFGWHKANERFLVNRLPVATVGIVWSQQNMDFYGRDDAEIMVDLPMRGMIQALIRARIPYLPVHADHIQRDGKQFAVLILPCLGILNSRQLDYMREFASAGGGIVATGDTSLYDEWGDRLSDYGLCDLFGAHLIEQNEPDERSISVKRASETLHTYLRLKPELRGSIDGPLTGKEPSISGSRHEVLKGFDETDILSYGGSLMPLKTDPGTETVMTFIPEFPVYPPETSWMRIPKTDIPGLILNTLPGGGRVAFMPGDIDRQFGRYNLPDHGNLLANLVRWTSKDNIPLAIDCQGLVDCNIYTQPDKLIIHIVNLTSTGTWRQPVDEYISIGPVKLRVKMPVGISGNNLKLLVAGTAGTVKRENGWCSFIINTVSNHEVAVIG